MSKWKNMKITTFKQRTISLSCLDESEQLIAWPARVKNQPFTTSIFSSRCTRDGDYAKSGTGNFRHKDWNILIFMISWILRCVFIDHILWLLYFFDVFTLLTLFIAILQLTQGPLTLSMKISPCTKKGTSTRLFVTICDENHIMFSFNPILDIPQRS